jgi:hypothetical protein
MALDIPALVRNAVKQAERFAGSVRATVGHRPIIGRDAYGEKHGDAIPREAMVEDLSQVVTSADGTERVSMAKLTFFESLDINEGDLFVLPDGKTGRVIKRGGLIDRGTSEPFVPEVWLGK